MSSSDGKLDDCHCCEWPTAPPIENAPGLPALAYRAGTWATFVDSMKVALAARPELVALTTRASDDPAIAMMDAWAVVGDILTFYQERIANEGFLRTATERRSVQELARSIGYELGAGVAASTHLAFTVDQSMVPDAGMPIPTTIQLATGTKVQSVPHANELPQTFETVEDVECRAEWNVMAPKARQRQRLQIDPTNQLLQNVTPDLVVTTTASIYLAGTGTNLRVGDLILVRVDPDKNQQQGDTFLIPVKADLCLYVTAVTPDYSTKTTLVELSQDPDAVEDPAVNIAFSLPPQIAGEVPTDYVPLRMSMANIRSYIIERDWTEEDLAAFIDIEGWDADRMVEHVAQALANDPAPAKVYAFRTHTGVFGHAGPSYKSFKRSYQITDDDPAPDFANWDDPETPIWTQSDGQFYSYNRKVDMYLERVVHNVAKRGWIALVLPNTLPDAPAMIPMPFQIAHASERSLKDFGLSGKATGVQLRRVPDEDEVLQQTDKEASPLLDFTFRDTTVYSASEQLDVAELPLVEQITDTDTIIVLDRMVLGLYEDQLVMLTGTVLDPETGLSSGHKASEVLTVVSSRHSRGYTIVTFAAPPENSYIRSTVTFNGNVAPATHGATNSNELLGSGDGSKTRQTFALRMTPLTFVSASTPTGVESTLKVRVGNVEWTEVPSFYTAGPTDRVFTSRQTHDGITYVTFGDGIHGARLPSGRNNVSATYRVGTGLAGNLKKKRISLLQSKPLGIKAATNPIASSGAADPEIVANARGNAPRTVRTLDRLVSLTDFEDFARGFAGIGKAQATPIWSGEQQVVHVTVGTAAKTPLDPATDLGINLIAAIALASDGRHQVIVDGFTARTFYLTVQLTIDPAYVEKKVIRDVRKALKAAFAYELRELAQAVTEAEIMKIAQSRRGVIATDVLELYDATAPDPILSGVLHAAGAHFDSQFGATYGHAGAELLLLHPQGLVVKAKEL